MAYNIEFLEDGVKQIFMKFEFLWGDISIIRGVVSTPGVDNMLNSIRASQILSKQLDS